jgi:hypothetical protein
MLKLIWAAAVISTAFAVVAAAGCRWRICIQSDKARL